MKTTIELPEAMFRKAKAEAAAHGQSLKDFFTHALQQKLTGSSRQPKVLTGWRSVWGKATVQQTREVDRIIQEEFSKIEPETWK